ncbi:MAG: ABC transporter substrate-binding protein [Clostridia bacterium]|nr:ABC transporter substrate-binding protein [Clostridia bacterium]
MFRRIIGLVMLVVLAVSCAACSTSAPAEESPQTPSPADTAAVSPAASEETAASEPSAESTAGTEGSVYWFLEGSPDRLESALEDVASLYTQQTGVPVEVRVASPDIYDEELTSEMNRSDPPTIFDVNSGYHVDRWGMHALDLTDTELAKEIDSTSYNMYDPDQKLVALGYAIDCFGIMVNPELLTQAGHSLEEIVDFPSLQAAAEDIHARSAELGFDAFTTIDLVTDGDVYTAHLANIDYYYEQGLERWFATPRTITGEYLGNYRNLYDLARLNGPAADGTDREDPWEQFEAGTSVFCFGGSWLWDAIKDAVPDATMIPYYCGVSGDELAGLNDDAQNHWAVNADVSEADQQASLDFMLWCVTDPAASRLLVDALGAMPYEHAQRSDNAFLAAADDYSKSGCYTMNWAFLCQPNPSVYRAELRAALQSYNENPTDETWQAFCQAFVDDWATEYLIMYPNANKTEDAVAEVTVPPRAEDAAAEADAAATENAETSAAA